MTDPYARLLTRNELASFLGISPRSIERLKSKRAIPHYKLPTGAVRYRYKSVLEALEKYKTNEVSL